MSWDEVETFLLDEAERDLRDGAVVRPCLVAYTGDERVLVSFLREYGRGGHTDAIIEVLALATPLGADRLALSISGRAWSFDDPIPPVLPGVGDLRQPVVALHIADRFAPAKIRSSVHPYDVVDGQVRWGEAVRDDEGSVEGWISSALHVAVTTGYGRITGSRREIRRQLDRCSARGHLIGLGDAVVERLGLVGWT